MAEHGAVRPPVAMERYAAFKRIARGRPMHHVRDGATVFQQGDPADAIYYVQQGKVKLRVTSRAGKEAVVAIFGHGDFFGEGCLAGQALRVATATAFESAYVLRIALPEMIAILANDPDFSQVFMTHLLSRNVRFEEDLVDQLFNSSEKRLARVLLNLANFGTKGPPEPVIAKISQETLAAMVGTTRSRVSFFMNKFRRLGFIDYDGSEQVHIHSSLLNVILQD